jgi:hypothetical protein
MAAVAVTTVTMPLLFWRRLVHSNFSSDVYFGDIFMCIDKDLESSNIVFIVMPEHDIVKRFLI